MTCPKCNGPTITKALFTSYYQHCEACESPAKPSIRVASSAITNNRLFWAPKQGELVQCIKSYRNEFTLGDTYIVDCVIGSALYVIQDNRGMRNGWNMGNFIPWKG